MPTGYTHAQVTLGAASGLPEDAIVNTFSFSHGATILGSPAAISQQLNTFYDAFGQHLSGHISRGASACTVDLYAVDEHLDGSPHGSPYFTDVFGIPAAGSSSDYPQEVALVLTLEGLGRATSPVEVTDNNGPDPDDDDSARDRPKQRRTGRVFLGPWNNGIAGAGGRPSSTVRTLIANAADAMVTGLAAASDPVTWCVWSRKNAAMYPVVGGWVDDAYDTQRSRGVAPTARTLWTA